MNTTLRRDADAIVRSSIQAVLPDEAVRRALEAFQPKGGRVLLVAAGKAAWQMAHAAVQALGRVDGGGDESFFKQGAAAAGKQEQHRVLCGQPPYQR